MTTKLTKPVTREFELYAHGTVGTVVATITNSGLELRRKGSGRKATLSWESFGKNAKLPDDAPIKFYEDAIGWLVEPKPVVQEEVVESVTESPSTAQ